MKLLKQSRLLNGNFLPSIVNTANVMRTKCIVFIYIRAYEAAILAHYTVQCTYRTCPKGKPKQKTPQWPTVNEYSLTGFLLTQTQGFNRVPFDTNTGALLRSQVTSWWNTYFDTCSTNCFRANLCSQLRLILQPKKL